MRKEAGRDASAAPKSRPVKRNATPPPKTDAKQKKKKPSTGVKSPEREASGAAAHSPPSPKAKKKLLKPKVVLTKLSPSTLQMGKLKPVKDIKKETSPKLVKPKPKNVIVSKATKKLLKLESDPKRATAAKIVKGVKKARSVVASKVATVSPKKLVNSGIKKIPGGSINVVKKHSIVKRVNKMSEKKPCVVSVKISNAHSTVTLSVKQNKQVNKKDSSKGSKSGCGKGSDRSTISIVKKGIASRRKSTSKDCAYQESTPSQSPTRDTSPMRCKEEKGKSKKSDNVKPHKKVAKQSSLDSNKTIEDKSKEKSSDNQPGENKDSKCASGKTEVIINDSVKIKTENVGESQNMEIEFTNGSMKDQGSEPSEKGISTNKDSDNRDKSKSEGSHLDIKVKSPSNDYGNLKSVDSSTSDEIPLETLKCKQKIKQEKGLEKPQEQVASPKNKKDKDISKSDEPERKKKFVKAQKITEKKKSEAGKVSKEKPPSTKVSAKKIDQEVSSKLKTLPKNKEKLKELALKQKVAKLVKHSKLAERKQNKQNQKQSEESSKSSDSDNVDRRRKKLMKFWSGPKRHRVASLNALAKVHCLYENESRGALNDVISSAAALQRLLQETKPKPKNPESKDTDKKPVSKKPAPAAKKVSEPASTRTLRTNPGVRSVGRNFDILNVISSTSLSSSSSEESSDSGEEKKQLVLLPSVKQKQLQIKKEELEQTSDDEPAKKSPTNNEESKDGVKKVKKRRRKRNELTMDLKDMVVRKRMASLNASAIMTASYSNEKKLEKKPESIKKEEESPKKERKKKKKPQSSSQEAEESSGDENVIVRATNNKQKVAVIVNQQDTDVTITGVYVNSTTRSTHHEGYCSIAGMQYRISSTSHTQTEATAVATTETVLHSGDHPPCLTEPGAAPPPTLPSPCKSYTPLTALSSMRPPCPQGPPPLSPLARRHGCSSAFSAPPAPAPHPAHHDVHGYYQPAGPLISTHHHHHHSSTSVTSKLPPPPTPTPPPASASAPEASDSEVVSAENPPAAYRYPPQHYSYGYNYYPSPPQYPQQSHYHQEICYPAPSGYPPGYFPKGHPYPYPRRYPPPPGHHQYYSPQDYYPNPPPPNPPPPAPNPPSGALVTATPAPADNSYPPPAPVVEPYPPPPPQSYYTGYSAGPPPPCYSTHGSSRPLFLDPAYQGCPCPMQSCPKNVHTGPLTGASKGSMKNHQTTPLPPVALALPLEPPGALGPPSPARGSAGMPPPPSPALATARNPPQSPPATGLLTIGKIMTSAVLLADQVMETSLADPEPIKLEVEDIVKVEATEEAKCNRKRRRSLKSAVDIKRQVYEPISESEVKVELQERLLTPKEEPGKTAMDLEGAVEKQVPLSDNGATLPVKNSCAPSILNGMIGKDQAKKRKSISCDSEPPVKLAKCGKALPKVLKNKCVKRNKTVAEENIAPEPEPVCVETAKVTCRRSSKPAAARRKSSCSPAAAVEETRPLEEEEEAGKKKANRTKKAEKTKADHLLRSHGKTDAPAVPKKERRLSKTGSTKGDKSVAGAVVVSGGGSKKSGAMLLDPSAESQVSLPGLRRNGPTPKWSNGWSWEGNPYKAKIFLKDDGAVMRTCYPAMRHVQGDIITPRDCVLLKSGPRKIDLPFVAKVAAMWENPDDGEMMVSLLWYYRPEHTEQGRRLEDIPDEIYASRHKDTNSVACIEDKCFVLTFNEYCRYRKTVRRLEEGLSQKSRVVPPMDEGNYPRDNRQPPGRVAPDLIFFCRRVYDFRQKRILKNPC